MRLLLDESLPRPLADLLVGHEVRTVPQMGWTRLGNGVLLRQAAADFTSKIMPVVNRATLPRHTLPRSRVTMHTASSFPTASYRRRRAGGFAAAY